MARATKPIFVVRFVRERPPLPTDPQSYRALRMDLKRLLRQFGWRAIDAREEQAEEQPAEVTEAST